MDERQGSPQRRPEAWLRYASGSFAAAATLFTLTAAGYALARLPLPVVLAGGALGAVLAGFGFYAKQRAGR